MLLTFGLNDVEQIMNDWMKQPHTSGLPHLNTYTFFLRSTLQCHGARGKSLLLLCPRVPPPCTEQFHRESEFGNISTWRSSSRFVCSTWCMKGKQMKKKRQEYQNTQRERQEHILLCECVVLRERSRFDTKLNKQAQNHKIVAFLVLPVSLNSFSFSLSLH